MNTRLLRKVADDILEHPENFDMAVVNCGTVCCIAGRAAILSGTPSHMVTVGARALGLRGQVIDYRRSNDTMRLCYVQNWPVRFKRKYQAAIDHKTKAKIAVARIEHFIKTKGAE